MIGPGLKIVLASTTLAVIAVAFVFSSSFTGSPGPSGAPPGSTLDSTTTVSNSGTASPSLPPPSSTVVNSATSSLILTSSGAGPPGSTGIVFRLSLDKAQYAGGGAAAVTVVLENDGAQPVTVDDPEVAPQLVVYGGGMNQVGSWARFQKPQEMNPPAGPVVLSGGERYSWTLQWDLAVTTSAGGGQVALAPGQYLVEATLEVGAGVPASYGPLVSNVVQITVG
jgi:hypothetical protein